MFMLDYFRDILQVQNLGYLDYFPIKIVLKYYQ